MILMMKMIFVIILKLESNHLRHQNQTNHSSDNFIISLTRNISLNYDSDDEDDFCDYSETRI
jgi:hypothetical protein